MRETKNTKKTRQITSSQLKGRILHCRWGHNMINNSFFIIEKETRLTVSVRQVGTNYIVGLSAQAWEEADQGTRAAHLRPGQGRHRSEPHPLTGYEIPDLNYSKDKVRIFRKSLTDSGTPCFESRGYTAFFYDGKPQFFDYLD